MNPPRRPRIVILNQSCLQVIAHLQDWINTLPVDVHIDQRLGLASLPEIEAAVGGADGLVLPASQDSRFPDETHLANLKSLKVIAIAASGYDRFDLEAATQHGIVVFNAPAQEGAEVVADHTFALMGSLARRIPHHHSLIQQGRIERGIGVSLWKKTLGIVGLGAIGKAVARRARGFDMRIVATTRRPDDQFNQRWGVRVTALRQLLKESDIVSLHTRLEQDTQGMIGETEFSLMKRSALLINTSRRALVDEASLVDALLAGRIGGAAMDDPPGDPHNPLLSLPNFIATPHLGNRAVEGMVAVLHLAVQQTIDALQGRTPRHLLNPQVYDSPRLRVAADGLTHWESP